MNDALIGLGVIAAVCLLLWLKARRDARKDRELYELLQRSAGPIRELPLRTLIELAKFPKRKPTSRTELPSRAWATKHPPTAERKRLARAQVAALLPQHIADFREEQKLCELPEPRTEAGRELVARLLAGEEIKISDPYWNKLGKFPFEKEGLARPLHHYRIGGRMVDYDHATGTIVLLEAWH